jgi:hypothetical protein
MELKSNNLKKRRNEKEQEGKEGKSSHQITGKLVFGLQFFRWGSVFMLGEEPRHVKNAVFLVYHSVFSDDTRDEGSRGVIKSRVPHIDRLRRNLYEL